MRQVWPSASNPHPSASQTPTTQGPYLADRAWEDDNSSDSTTARRTLYPSQYAFRCFIDSVQGAPAIPTKKGLLTDSKLTPFDPPTANTYKVLAITEAEQHVPRPLEAVLMLTLMPVLLLSLM